jgi:SAM-dependent methyltransferase
MFRKLFKSKQKQCFDPEFYLQTYPDIAERKMDPKRHYDRYGKLEGRKACKGDPGVEINDMEALFPNVPKKIHELDEMYLFAKQNPDIKNPDLQYLKLGNLIVEDVLTALNELNFKSNSSTRFLDFASGYGRVTRFWLQHFKPEQIYVADAHHGGVDFQKDYFGVNGFYSHFDPQKLTIPQHFDLITAISLFSHLPKQRFIAWLGVLSDRLKPGGYFIFSIHHQRLMAAEVAEQFFKGGFAFFPNSESAIHPGEEYGTTYVDEGFLNLALADIKKVRMVKHLPHGLCDFQDLVVLQKEPD